MDLTKSKKISDQVTKYKEDPKALYNMLRDEKITLSTYLESLDPSQMDVEGKRIDKFDALERHLMVNGIQLQGRNQFTVEKLFELATYLMPELMKREIEAGMRTADRFNVDDLIAVTVPVVGATYHPIYIPDLSRDTAAKKKAKARSLNISGSEYPKMEILYREKSIQLKDYGVALDVAYKVLKNQSWADMAVFLRLVGAEISAQKMTDIYNLGIAGDGSVGAATNVFNGTDGTLAYKDWVHAYTVFESPFTMTKILADQDTFETTLNLSQFSDPGNAANALFQKTGSIQTPFGANMKLVTSSSKQTVTDKYAVLLDANYAVREAKAQDLLIETDKIIDRKIEEAVISEESVYSIIADGAIKQFEWAS